MNFLFDHNLPPRVARALDHLDSQNSVVALRDKFPQDSTDIEWMAALSADGEWAVITGDLRISRNAMEHQVWRESGLVIFFLRRGWHDLGLWEFSSKLIKRWPQIVDAAHTAHPGSGFDVSVRSVTLARF